MSIIRENHITEFIAHWLEGGSPYTAAYLCKVCQHKKVARKALYAAGQIVWRRQLGPRERMVIARAWVNRYACER